MYKWQIQKANRAGISTYSTLQYRALQHVSSSTRCCLPACVSAQISTLFRWASSMSSRNSRPSGAGQTCHSEAFLCTMEGQVVVWKFGSCRDTVWRRCMIWKQVNQWIPILSALTHADSSSCSFVFIRFHWDSSDSAVTHIVTVGFAQTSESLWISRMGTCLHREAWEDKGVLMGLPDVVSKQKKWVCLKIGYPYTQWFCWSLSLLNGYNWGYTPFSDIPKFTLLESVDFRRSHSLPR